MSGLPGEGHALRPGSFRLPGLEVQHLAVAVKSQNVALRDYTGVALLASLLRRGDVAFDSVVGPVRWSDVGARAAEQREPSVSLASTLLPF